MTEVTRILSQIEEGDPSAAEELLPLVYDELRRLAKAKLAQEKAGQTLQATALVHDAYLRLVDVQQAQRWGSRRHFFAAAAEAMRRILVENARRKGRLKHGGQYHHVELPDELTAEWKTPAEEVLSLHESLDQLQEEDPSAAELVKMRFFAGLTLPEIAEITGSSLRTIEREWTYARTWLHRALSSGDSTK